MESLFKKDPALCKKFVAASIEGWSYALTHIDETINVVDKYKEMAKVADNKSHAK